MMISNETDTKDAFDRDRNGISLTQKDIFNRQLQTCHKTYENLARQKKKKKDRETKYSKTQSWYSSSMQASPTPQSPHTKEKKEKKTKKKKKVRLR